MTIPNYEMTKEEIRLQQSRGRRAHWKRWGPYLSERAWGTVREDYSPYGTAWDFLPHDHARSKAYRWGEDGLGGICNRKQHLCFAVALWNGRDPILKERLFGLTGSEGNHSEDVKEYYFYLDSTPTHSYMKYLYKYPHAEFPYTRLVEENRRRGRQEGEFELIETGVFNENRYFDLFAEYAKASPDDILIRLSVANRGPEAAPIHLLPTLWFRNTWTWHCTHEGCSIKPRIALAEKSALVAAHETLGKFRLDADRAPEGRTPQFLFTDNETKFARVFGAENSNPYVKDAFHEYVIGRRRGAVNPKGFGTKAAAYYRFTVPAGGEIAVRLRLRAEGGPIRPAFGSEFDEVFKERIREADEFYAHRLSPKMSGPERAVARQACAGLLQSKQFYHYIVK